MKQRKFITRNGYYSRELPWCVHRILQKYERVQEKTENNTKERRVGRTTLECCLFSPMGAFQLNCKLKRIFYSSASESAGISRESKGQRRGWRGKEGWGIGRIASQQELSLPFSAGENFFLSSATPCRCLPFLPYREYRS